MSKSIEAIDKAINSLINDNLYIMDWGFIDILKKADINKLMLSIAITAWTIFFLFSKHIYVFAGGILSTAYCVISLIVHIYQRISTYVENKRKNAQLIKEIEKKNAEKKRVFNIEISRLFDGLIEENKNLLAEILLKGKVDSYSKYVLHFQNFFDDYSLAKRAQNITDVLRDANGNVIHIIVIQEYRDSFSVSINSYLYDLIKKYIEENHITSEGTND